MKLFLKNVLKLLILIIHWFTRTPAIILYYFSICIGLFGPTTFIITDICFAFSVLLVIINIFIFVLFNNSMTKEKCISLVGKNFFDTYLTHSAPAGKSLIRLGSGIVAPAAAEFVTSWQNERSFFKTKASLRTDIYWARKNGDFTGLRNSQETLNSLIREHKPGGMIVQVFRAETTKETLGFVSDAAKEFIHKYSSRNK